MFQNLRPLAHVSAFVIAVTVEEAEKVSLNTVLFYFLGSWVPSILQLTLKSICFFQGVTEEPRIGGATEPGYAQNPGTAHAAMKSLSGC